jgi:uncharacterized protein (DUF305 family)
MNFREGKEMKNKLFFSALALFALAIFGANVTFAQDNMKMGNMQMSGGTDLQFLDMMLMHHADGVKMAQTGVDKAQNAGVKALAKKMADGQQKDIEEMQKMRDSHFSGQPKQEMMTVKRREMTMEMMMKMAEEDLRKLEAASGTEFDRTFLDVFLKHHQMAIDMSREEVSKGKTADVKKKAREIISKQTKEMSEMKRLKAQVAAKK